MNIGNRVARIGSDAGKAFYVSPLYNNNAISKIDRPKKVKQKIKVDIPEALSKKSKISDDIKLKAISANGKTQNLRYEPMNSETLKIVFLDGSMLVGVYIDKIV